MTNPIDKLVKSLLTSYTVIGVIALLLGSLVAPAIMAGAVQPQQAEEEYVAVVTLDESIYAGSADSAIDELRDVRENDSIKAVVLEVDSPGGAASASEAQYMAVKRLSEEKPVVTAVRGMAASGMYYTILPTEEIFVTPASLVGNVGVRTSLPGSDGVPSQVSTGPDKISGGTADETRARVRTLKNAFVGTVMEERGDRLTLSREEVAHGKIYAGARATENGIADSIGDTETAIQAAADEADLSEYRITERNPASSTGLFILAGSGTNATVVQKPAFGYEGADTVHYLMLYGIPETESEVINNGS